MYIYVFHLYCYKIGIVFYLEVVWDVKGRFLRYFCLSSDSSCFNNTMPFIFYEVVGSAKTSLQL